MNKPAKKTPNKMTELEEMDYWDSQDDIDIIDWSKAKRAVFPNLKPTTRTISIRLPVSMIDNLKAQANKRDIPYQSLMKVYLHEKILEDYRSRPRDTKNRKA